MKKIVKKIVKKKSNKPAKQPIGVHDEMVGIMWSMLEANVEIAFQNRPDAAKLVEKKLGMAWKQAWNTVLIEAGIMNPKFTKAD